MRQHRRSKPELLVLFVLGTALALPSTAMARAVQTEHTEAELVAEMQHVRPGEDSWVALRLRPDRGWHTYWRNPGDSGLPTRLEWALPDGVTAGAIHWPYPQAERLGDIVNYGYSRETFHLVPVTVPTGWPVSRPLELQLQAKWLVCEEICIPGEAALKLELPVSHDPPRANPRWQAGFAEARARLPQPSGWAARFAVGEEDVSLRIETDALRDARQVAYFPVANDLVTHSAPQRIVLDDGGLSLSQVRSSYLQSVPDSVEGVVVVTQRGGTRAYRVEARAGPVAAAGLAVRPPATPAPGLGLALLFALLGGLILNLMPCVFPVLSLKAVALLEARDESAARKRRHALAYTTGVLLAFMGLAGALLFLRESGQAIGWGFQLQQPLFVAVLAYLFFAMGLSLSGVVQFGTRLMGLGQALTHGDSLRGSFFTGVLAVIVASPCTAPFMGVAMGYAFIQSPGTALAVFAALGFGLALPFLLLGFVPVMARALPRPGAWMETFKQAMAFPLYLTVVWLLWVLGGLVGRDGMTLALAGLTLVGLALWLWPRGGRIALLTRVTALLAAVLLLAHPALQHQPPVSRAHQSEWEPWSPARVAELRAQQRTVLVNFTADWCVTCLVNERGALRASSVQKALDDRQVALLKADWTRADPAITGALAQFGRSGVPLYLVYREGGEPQVLPQLLTPEIIISAFEQ